VVGVSHGWLLVELDWRASPRARLPPALPRPRHDHQPRRRLWLAVATARL